MPLSPHSSAKPLSPDSPRILSPAIQRSRLFTSSCALRVFAGSSASHVPKRSGSTLVCANAPADIPAANTDTAISFRITTFSLDANSLLLVPGLFHCGDHGGAIGPFATVHRNAVHALQIRGNSLINSLRNALPVLRLLQ